MFGNVCMAFGKNSENLRKSSEDGENSINTESCSDFSQWLDVAQNAKSCLGEKKLLKVKKVARNMKLPKSCRER